MKYNRVLYKIMCAVFAFILIPLTLSPIITLAFTDVSIATQAPPPEEEPQAVNNQPIESPFIDIAQQPEELFMSNNKPLVDSYTVAERKTLNLSNALPAIPPYYGEKVVYLTFDDGPDPEITPKVLQILTDNKIKATFFVVGTQAELHPDVLKRIYAEGHAIGNHSYNHVYRDLYKSAITYLDQLHRTDEIIKKTTGVRPRISRAPGGSAGTFTSSYWQALKTEGYIEVGWNVSSGDASTADAKQIYGNITQQMEKKFLWSHAIVLMHDGRGHKETLKALPAIIAFFKEKGFEFRVINLETPPAW